MIIEAMNDTSPLPPGILTLDHLGVIRVEGDDAAKFIHGQLTHDFSLLGADQARLCALCSPKGRMLASFIGFKRSPTEILLVCNRDILQATLKRLSMFVMRAKAKLSDASADFSIWGLVQPVAATDKPWQLVVEGEANAIVLYPAAGMGRRLLVVPADSVMPAQPVLSASLWAWAEVLSGIATISAPVVDAFVPQMLNYESVDGVSFKKGCYPGQEVVARSQFRGTLKRRGFVVHCPAALDVGQEIFGPQDDSQPVGTVAQVAADPAGGFVAIASLQVAAAEAGGLKLAGESGAAVDLLPLPYRLLEDV